MTWTIKIIKNMDTTQQSELTRDVVERAHQKEKRIRGTGKIK